MENVEKMFGLKGENAVVVGASRGIGKALCLGLAQVGANVIPVGRTTAKLEETAREAKQFNVEAYPVTCDVTSIEEVKSLKEEAFSRFEKIDILINSQGMNYKKWSFDLTEQEFADVINTNLNSLYNTCKAFGTEMVNARSGKIINIGSMASYLAISRSTAYTASKGGVLLLTKNLALEWAPYNVRVNCIAPGFFHTEITEGIRKNKDAYDRMITHTPMGREGKVEELVGAAVYLSSSASDFVTGICLPVDGGFLTYGN